MLTLAICCSLIFVGKMCVFVSCPMKSVTFLWKNRQTPTNGLLIFLRKKTRFRNKIMEIVEDFDEKSSNNNCKPWKSSRILRVSPNFFIFSLFIIFRHFFFILQFFIFLHFLSFSFIFFHFLSFSVILFHVLSFSFVLFHFLLFSYIFFHILSLYLSLSFSFSFLF